MCLRRAPEKYIAGAALDRAGLDSRARLWALRNGLDLLARNIIFSASGTHFCQRLSKPQGIVRLEGLDKLNKLIHLITHIT
jgi:hypothetical protein